MKFQFAIWLMFTLILFCSCSEKAEEGDGWHVCSDCDMEDWIGIYYGKASYYHHTTNETTENLDIEIEIEQTATDYLCLYIHIENFYTATLCGDFADPYSISFGSSSSSIYATLYEKDNQVKLIGNSKKFVHSDDTTIYKETINFEVF
jgi:hypothetical protein